MSTKDTRACETDQDLEGMPLPAIPPKFEERTLMSNVNYSKGFGAGIHEFHFPLGKSRLGSFGTYPLVLVVLSWFRGFRIKPTS